LDAGCRRSKRRFDCEVSTGLDVVENESLALGMLGLPGF